MYVILHYHCKYTYFYNSDTNLLIAICMEEFGGRRSQETSPGEALARITNPRQRWLAYIASSPKANPRQRWNTPLPLRGISPQGEKRKARRLYGL